MTRNEKHTAELTEKLNITKQKKLTVTKTLLTAEIFLGAIAVVAVLMCVALGALFINVGLDGYGIAFMVIGTLVFLAGVCYCLRIEQLAGYYKCKECNHCYVPTYKSVFLAPHVCRTRYMKCPECGKHSWQKKVLTKD